MANPRKLKDAYVAIHGHFYQPPRENPWLEVIETEESARPFHDWNERIAFESYRPNAYARIVDEHGKILDLVNNYASINFNFGPTLLSWMERKLPRVYRKILEADRHSLRRFGHGNAIAQAYHHTILPLSNERDRETEILWGLVDFEKRFHREPEAMWLPETAVNDDTLRRLVKHGMQYLILSPFQAHRVRPFGGKRWTVVSGGGIDPTHPYRCFLKDASGKKVSDQFIDLFFYDGVISKEVAFGDSLKDGKTFCDRFLQAYQPSGGRPQLIHIATDGESYGHHKKFGDMTLAYALGEGFLSRGLEVINYGAFLKRFPPVDEVEIDEGPQGEGSSWSCSHGVSRWKEDCGCSTGGKTGWNQKWRKPLRESLDALKDDLGLIFENEGQKIFKDVWEARNGYIEVILERSPSTLDRFFSQHGIGGISGERKARGLKLLEMERHALKMYTSCGWFFSDLAGLETVLILQNAARAIQLAEELVQRGVEERFLKRFRDARSNLPEMGNGEEVYLRLVKPRVVTQERVVNHFAISSLLVEEEREKKIFSYQVERLDYERMDQGDRLLVLGQADVSSKIIPEKRRFLFALTSSPGDVFRTWVLEPGDRFDFNTFKGMGSESSGKGEEEMAKAFTSIPGNRSFTLRDIFIEKRKAIFQKLIEKDLDEHLRIYAELFDRSRQTVESLAGVGLDLPYEIRAAAEITLSHRLLCEVGGLQKDLKKAIEKGEIDRILEEARRYAYHLRKEESLRIFNRLLKKRMEAVREALIQRPSSLPEGVQEEELKELILLLNSAARWDFQVGKEDLQDLMGDILDACVKSLEESWWENGAEGRRVPPDLATLAEKLGFNIDRFSKMISRSAFGN